MKITDHKIQGAPYVPTEKKGGTIEPRAIVLHYTAGWTTEGDIHTLAKSDRPASAHVVLSRDGKYTQIVPFNRRAWHAGPSRWPLRAAKGKAIYEDLNDASIGIEVSNIGWLRPQSNGNFVDAYGTQIKPNGQFVGAKRKTATPPSDWPKYRWPVVGSGVFAWEPYTPAQLDQLEELIEALAAQYPIKHILSHQEIDERGSKADPGPLMPMDRYRKIIEPRYTPSKLPTSPAPIASATAPARGWFSGWRMPSWNLSLRRRT